MVFEKTKKTSNGGEDYVGQRQMWIMSRFKLSKREW